MRAWCRGQPCHSCRCLTPSSMPYIPAYRGSDPAAYRGCHRQVDQLVTTAVAFAAADMHHHPHVGAPAHQHRWSETLRSFISNLQARTITFAAVNAISPFEFERCYIDDLICLWRWQPSPGFTASPCRHTGHCLHGSAAHATLNRSWPWPHFARSLRQA